MDKGKPEPVIKDKAHKNASPSTPTFYNELSFRPSSLSTTHWWMSLNFQVSAITLALQRKHVA